MGSKITVKVLSGSRITQADVARAEAAALEILEGRDIGAIYAKFVRQWPQVEDYRQLTQEAILWLVAENAANNGLTKGWNYPHVGMCTIAPATDIA